MRNTTGSLFLNLQKILIVLTPYYPICIWEHEESKWGIANPENFFIVEHDGYVVRYGFVERVDSQLILMTINLFFYVCLMYYIHQFFIQYAAFS